MAMNKYKIFLICLLVVNIVTFLLFGYDKLQAKKNRWRIAEKTLFIFSILGGSVGAIAGMKVWRHKTRKKHFKFGIPLILILELSGVLYFVLKG